MLFVYNGLKFTDQIRTKIATHLNNIMISTSIYFFNWPQSSFQLLTLAIWVPVRFFFISADARVLHRQQSILLLLHWLVSLLPMLKSLGLPGEQAANRRIVFSSLIWEVHVHGMLHGWVFAGSGVAKFGFERECQALKIFKVVLLVRGYLRSADQLRGCIFKCHLWAVDFIWAYWWSFVMAHLVDYHFRDFRTWKTCDPLECALIISFGNKYIWYFWMIFGVLI